MKFKALLLTAVAATLLTTTGAVARDRDRDGRPDHSWSERHDRDGYRDGYRDRDRDGRPDRSWGERHDRDGYMDRGWRGGHDRYWRHGYNSYAHRDVFYRNLRHHNYTRWAGDPYWFQGRYVIRTYDRWGRLVFVEMNPYTGDVMGVVRF